ncbi:uroporphyrinogen-III synthase [Arthrobacter sp.]|uniref:uroporphyrinogen-III synthase n=1 Tax=Arthrobacter sp. TaxID=1667 RepID=UPI003A959DD9
MGNDPVVATAYRTVDARQTLPGPWPPPARTPGPDLSPADLAAAGGAPRGVEAVLFTSPSIVRRYLALAGPAPHLPAIAIGDSTAAALRNHGWEPAATATEASPAGLANAWEHALDRAGPAHG